MARSFRLDLDAARTNWIAKAETDAERERREKSDSLRFKDSDGRVADFHATRHTFISAIVAGGASVKTTQELARHSTPTLTIGRYSHARRHDLAGALEALPDLRPQQPEPTTLRATGTEYVTADSAQHAKQIDPPRLGAIKKRQRRVSPAKRTLAVTSYPLRI
jgi:hypothetical protein